MKLVRRTFLASAAGIAVTLASAATALGGATPAPAGTRREHRSNHNIRTVRRHLDRVIDELQHDQHDYGGHRAAAVDLLQRARQELLAAEEFDRRHPS